MAGRAAIPHLGCHAVRGPGRREHRQRPVRAAGGPVAAGLVTYAGTAAFFWWTMYFLLAGRVPLRRLIHAALLTALPCIGLELFCAVYF